MQKVLNAWRSEWVVNPSSRLRPVGMPNVSRMARKYSFSRLVLMWWSPLGYLRLAGSVKNQIHHQAGAAGGTIRNRSDVLAATILPRLLL